MIYWCRDEQVNLPKGYGYVEFKRRGDAEKALAHMDGVCELTSQSGDLLVVLLEAALSSLV